MKADATKLTVDTYNRSARQFAKHFQDYADGVAREEIDRAFELAGNPQNARVVEIGCGAGKDAAAIVRRTTYYEGFDPSEKLLEIARMQVPEGAFVQSDAVAYPYPPATDIVFAFASMLHVDKDGFAVVCAEVADALRPGGIFCLTLKEADRYTPELQQDDFGTRQFYLYNPQLVRQLAGSRFEQVFEAHDEAGPKRKKWFTIMLKRMAS